jgi:hypothetical protein
MVMYSYRGVMQENGQIRIDEDVDIPIGAELIVTVLTDENEIEDEGSSAANPPLEHVPNAQPSPAPKTNRSYQQLVDEKRQEHPRAYEKWEPVEEDELVWLFEQGKSMNEIAGALSRQPSAIKARLRRLGLIE